MQDNHKEISDAFQFFCHHIGNVINGIFNYSQKSWLNQKAREHKSKIIQRKYTQKMLSEELNLSRGYIGDIENGRIYPSYVLLTKIAEICDVPLSFFEGPNNPNNSDSLNDSIQPLNCNGIESSKTNHVETSTNPSYLAKNSSVNYPIITDVKQAMELILAQPGLMLNGELLSDESKIAIANALNMGLAYAKQLQQKKR